MEQKKKYNIRSLDFLNASIDEIYYRKKHYITGVDLLNFKGQMSSYFVQIERLFRYVYFSDNFPKDVCNKCGASGVFDECPVCKSKDITRIRRVSGYLEILDGFTKGKKNEEKNRRAN